MIKDRNNTLLIVPFNLHKRYKGHLTDTEFFQMATISKSMFLLFFSCRNYFSNYFILNNSQKVNLASTHNYYREEYTCHALGLIKFLWDYFVSEVRFSIGRMRTSIFNYIWPWYNKSYIIMVSEKLRSQLQWKDDSNTLMKLISTKSINISSITKKSNWSNYLVKL